MYVSDSAGNRTNMISGSFEVETDTIHIAWKDSGGIKYSRKDNISSWSSSETVSTGAGTYLDRTSLAVDNTNVPVVSYAFDDGSESDMRFKRRTSGVWGTSEVAGGLIGTADSATQPNNGMFGEIALTGGNATNGGIVNTVFLGYDSGGDQGLRFGSNASAGLATYLLTTAALTKDMAIASGPGSTSPLYGVATVSDGTNYSIQIMRKDQFAKTLNRPSGCANAQYVSAVAKSDTTISLAFACHMTNNSCSTFYGDITYNSSTNEYTTPGTWTTVGTIRSSSCSATTLTSNDRPSIMIDRQKSNNVSIAWIDRTGANDIVKRWSNENSNDNENVVTASGIGQAVIGLDASSKSYIIYTQGTDVKFLTNNSRAASAVNGGWTGGIAGSSDPATIATGVNAISNIGLTGMKGRGNITSGN
jgi:hypothetical protein